MKLLIHLNFEQKNGLSYMIRYKELIEETAKSNLRLQS